MFSIYDFMDFFPKAIVQRGENYFENGHVKKVKEGKKGTWSARVEGSEKYTVTVTVTDNIIVEDYYCDCPYDGDACKHVAAMLFYLAENMTIDTTPAKEENEPEKKSAAKKKKPSFDSMLDSISQDEYKDFIKQYSASDKKFKSEFELYFSHKNESFDIVKAYTSIIRKLLKSSSHSGYMDYRSTKTAAREIASIIGTVEEYVAKGNLRDALSLSKTLIFETCKGIEYCDDSSGMLGDVIFTSIELLSELVNKSTAPYSIKEQSFDFLEKELDNSLYFDYGDFGYSLEDIFQELALTLNRHDTYLDFIERQLKKYSHSYHRKNHYTCQKVIFLKSIGKISEADLLVKQNIDIPEIREAEVEKHVRSSQYDKARVLAAEGLAIAKKAGFWGTINHWKDSLLKIATLENDISNIRLLAKDLAFSSGFKASYYDIWKGTYNNEEWLPIIEEHIESLIKSSIVSARKPNFSSNPYLLEKIAPVYIQEGMLDRLLGLLKEEGSLHNVLKHHNDLIVKYPSELLEIYLPAFEEHCHYADNRSAYRELASTMIKVMKTLPGSDVPIREMALQLIKKYPKRRAMIEELEMV